jgi:hypothetical protein
MGCPGPESSQSQGDAFSPPDEFEEFVEERRRAIDQMIWQVPGLSVAAQAFLYVVALNSNVSDLVRMLAALIALIAALATVQLLLKHRFHEETFSLVIDASRKRRGVHSLEGLGWFKDIARMDAETEEVESGVKPGYLKRWSKGALPGRVANPSSVAVWTATLCVFATADTLLVIGAVLDHYGVVHLFV